MGVAMRITSNVCDGDCTPGAHGKPVALAAAGLGCQPRRGVSIGHEMPEI
jgi:hypothetical protein